MRQKMKRMICASAMLFALAAFGTVPAQAQVGHAPWCAVISLGTGSVYWDCHYATLEQCVPNVLAGNRGFCNHNPGFYGYEPVPEGPRRHRRHARRG
jgi:Protein of unknown function (DUF3551)